MEQRIDALLKEGETLTFENNCFSNKHGTFGRMSSDFYAWHTKVEHLVSTMFGIDSSAFRLLNALDLSSIEGNLRDNFDQQHNIIVGALKAARGLCSIEDTNNLLSAKRDCQKVFIVHGHDESAKIKVARFIEKLGFTPIILHEQASSGKTIIEKIEEHSNVGFGIVLYTPCDVGGKNIEAIKARARQNVVFEHGYLIGKIGRSNVCALVKGDIETPNDISGVVYINMDESDGWHFPVAKELRSSGFVVDMNRL